MNEPRRMAMKQNPCILFQKPAQPVENRTRDFPATSVLKSIPDAMRSRATQCVDIRHAAP